MKHDSVKEEYGHDTKKEDKRPLDMIKITYIRYKDKKQVTEEEDNVLINRTALFE